MGGDVDTIKEKLDIAEVISGYVKLEKAGASFKGRCPFHNEKTPSFFVSPVRQSYFCFGCGAKGDIFTFIEVSEGLDFRGSLRFLAEKAGVELEYTRSESKTEKNELYSVLEKTVLFFEKELENCEPARHYIISRGISEESVKDWRIGYVPDEWRLLWSYLRSLGYSEEIIVKAGLAKTSDASSGKEPYDVFRDRIIFPLFDPSGRVVAFSGRALSKDTEPKYLNSPDTALFTKSEVLYGLDKAKDHIRKKDYAVLVEGQVDLVLSHQSGVNNTVATSGTAFTSAHLERLRRLSSRIILAFDGDPAGENAGEKATILGISLGFEVKVATLPLGEDPAEIIKKDPTQWKNILRESLPAVEFFFNKVKEKEKDPRKLGKAIEKKILPLVKLLGSSIEQSHFVSLISKHSGIKEEMIWEDLKRVKKPEVTSSQSVSRESDPGEIKLPTLSYKEQIEKRLDEIRFWRSEVTEVDPRTDLLKKEEIELTDNLESIILRDKLSELLSELSRAEALGEKGLLEDLTHKIQAIHVDIRALEEKKKIL